MRAFWLNGGVLISPSSQTSGLSSAAIAKEYIRFDIHKGRQVFQALAYQEHHECNSHIA
jgi:hypothetical protein